MVYEDIAPLDLLEGYPDFYGRMKISVKGIMKPSIIHRAAWAYFINDLPQKDDLSGVEEYNGIQWWDN